MISIAPRFTLAIHLPVEQKHGIPEGRDTLVEDGVLVGVEREVEPPVRAARRVLVGADDKAEVLETQVSSVHPFAGHFRISFTLEGWLKARRDL